MITSWSIIVNSQNSVYIQPMKQPSFWDQIKQYLFLKKKPSDQPNEINLKLMHGMNRISILMFLVAVIIMIYRLLVKR